MMALMRDFGSDIFAGAAGYYAKYRPGYPRGLFLELASTFGLDGKGQLLDLGCGTGELAIPLAEYFAKVLAVDPNREMLAEGRRKARKLKIANVHWRTGSSKELNRLNGPFKLVCMGRSFHWMDQKKVLEDLYPLIEKGGGLAVIGTELTKQGPLGVKRDEIIKKLVIKYLGPRRRAGSKIYSHPQERYEDLLPNSKFRGFERHFYTTRSVMNIDQTIGNLYSMSWANPNLFGGRLADFEAELRRQLAALNPDGSFGYKIRFGMYTMTK